MKGQAQIFYAIIFVAIIALLYGIFAGDLIPQSRLTPDNTETCVNGNWVVSGVVTSSACITPHLPGTVQTYEGSGTLDWYNSITFTCPTTEQYIYDYCVVIGYGNSGQMAPGQTYKINMISNIGRIPVAVQGYEYLITCGDGAINYRSSCPKAIICSNGTQVYAPNTCKNNTGTGDTGTGDTGTGDTGTENMNLIQWIIYQITKLFSEIKFW